MASKTKADCPSCRVLEMKNNLKLTIGLNPPMTARLGVRLVFGERRDWFYTTLTALLSVTNGPPCGRAILILGV